MRIPHWPELANLFATPTLTSVKEGVTFLHMRAGEAAERSLNQQRKEAQAYAALTSTAAEARAMSQHHNQVATAIYDLKRQIANAIER